MAVEIGALRALLSLDSAAFEAGAKRARASMNRLQRSMAKTSDRMGRIGRQMSTRATAPLAAGAGLMARSAVTAAFEIERLAQVSDAGTTEFQRFAAGAREVGIQQDKLADILKDTQDRVGDFIATGGGPMADFFENIAPKVGVTAEQFAKLSGPEALQLYVSSLEKAGVNQQEMTFYMEALASDATLLLPLLRDNGAEMQRFGDAAENAGAIMDQKTIKALLRSRDAMREAGDEAKGLFNQLMASLAPVLETVAEAVGEAARSFSDLSPQMKQMIGVAGTLAAAIGPLAIALGFVATGIAALASPIGLTVLAFGAAAGATAYLVAQWEDLKKRFPILQRAADFGAKIKEKWSDLPAIKWALLIPALRWARFIPGLRWAAFIPRIAWVSLAGALKWGSLIGKLSWTALRVIPGIGWAALAGSLAWSALVKKIEWDGWIPRIQWRNWVPSLRWSDFIPSVDWSAIINGGETASGPLLRGEMRRRGRQIGEGLSEGAAEGARAGANDADAAARDVMRGMEGAARDESETQSPSRKWMRIGRDLMDGLSIGISDNASAAAEAAAGAAKQVTTVVEQSQGALGTFKDATKTIFRDVLTGANSFRESLSGVLSSIGNRFIDVGLSQLVDGLFGGGFGSLAPATSPRPVAPSFAGGGYTGSGPRTGGLDGKGGFPAILHPRETVVDHAKGGGRTEVVVRLDDGLRAEILDQAGQQTVQIVSAAGQAQQRNFGAQVQQYQDRGTSG